MGYYENKYDENLKFKNWNVYFIKFHEKVFEISNLEPTIYYRKTALLNYVLAVKSLHSLAKIYIVEYIEEIEELDKILDIITSKDFMTLVIKESNLLANQPNTIFILDNKLIELAKKTVKIFEFIQYNLSMYEILPKSQKKQKPKFVNDDITEEEKKYLDFITYIEN